MGMASFLVDAGGDAGVDEWVAAKAAAVARVTRRSTGEQFSPTVVASFSTLSLLRRCLELRRLLRVFLRDSLQGGQQSGG